jgi:hypothetical protein
MFSANLSVDALQFGTLFRLSASSFKRQGMQHLYEEARN